MQNKGTSKFWKVVNLAGNAIAMNVLFLVACLPVVTIAPAICGLYSAIRFTIRGDGWFAGFKEGFRNKFLRTAVVGSLGILWIADMLTEFNIAVNFYLEGNPTTPMIIYGIGMILPLMIFAALWPMNVYFSYDLSQWLKKTIRFILKAPLQVLLTAVLLALPVGMILYFPDLAFMMLIVFIGVYFSVALFISTIFLKDGLVKMLLEYREEYPEEAQQDTVEEVENWAEV